MTDTGNHWTVFVDLGGGNRNQYRFYTLGAAKHCALRWFARGYKTRLRNPQNHWLEPTYYIPPPRRAAP